MPGVEMDYEKGLLIADGDHVIINMPSTRSKMAQIIKGKEISLGKFGKFQAENLIGKPYNMTYEIDTKKSVCSPCGPENVSEILNTFNQEALFKNPNADNRDLVDNSSAQKLSQADIEQLKEDAILSNQTGAALVQKLVANSETFDNKTGFSKQKYLRNKERKFGRRFVAVKPTARSISEYYQQVDFRKIRELRFDTLSQMMSLANVRSGSRVIVLDDAAGILVAALMERMNGNGEIIVLHEHDTYSTETYKYLNLPKSHSTDILRTLPFFRLKNTNMPDEDIANYEAIKHLPEKYERAKNRINRIHETRAILESKTCDLLISTSQFDPSNILLEFADYLTGSASIVFYSSHREHLLECFRLMRSSPEYVDAQISESFMREYQIPANGVSGTHPMMRMMGSSGSVLSAIRTRIQHDIKVHAASFRGDIDSTEGLLDTSDFKKRQQSKTTSS